MPKWISQGSDQLRAWLSRNWFSHHLAFIPIGTWGATWLLLDITGAESNWWTNWQALQNAGQTAPFGAATYGAFILPLEIGLRIMFWAIEQFLNRDKKAVTEYIQTLEEQARASGVVQVGTMRLAVIDPLSAPAGTDEIRAMIPPTHYTGI